MARIVGDKMNEADVKDKWGNIVISPGLKVRHKSSQFEYTVEKVLQEPSGEITIMLSSPEEPRFDPTGEETVMTDRRRRSKVLYEVDPVPSLDSLYYFPDESEEPSGEDLLAVSAKEFEREYEVR